VPALPLAFCRGGLYLDDMVRVRIYTTHTCPYCFAAKQLFEEKGIEYEEVDVTTNAQARSWLREVTGRSTVPQVFIDGRSYGGFTDVARLDRRGELDPLLALAD
jgi:glutaredoxin 3